MKYILLIRHAKAEQQLYYKDAERKLTERGHNDCAMMSKRLKDKNILPHLILISPAARTMETAINFSSQLGWEKECQRITPQIYQASLNNLKSEIIKIDNKVETIAIIGHNPGITELFNFLGNTFIDNLPTCGIGFFKFDLKNWADLIPHIGKLEWCSWPKKDA